jgi:Zn-finger nucleic acid-binding protein
MICPACGRELVVLTVEGLVVDVCRGGCGGMWFDHFELDKVDEAHERLGAALLAVEFDPAVKVEEARRNCPKCFDVVLMKHKFSPAKPVLVDECPKCGGVWLDGGELAQIRRQAPTDEDRKKAAQRFFDRAFVEDLARLKQRRADRLQSRS